MGAHLGWLGKGLQALGLLVILVGVLVSIGLGHLEQGLSSMMVELQALLIGVLLFAAGTFLLRVGGRGGP
jgi:hypothetical protein